MASVRDLQDPHLKHVMLLVLVSPRPGIHERANFKAFRHRQGRKKEPNDSMMVYHRDLEPARFLALHLKYSMSYFEHKLLFVTTGRTLPDWRSPLPFQPMPCGVWTLFATTGNVTKNTQNKKHQIKENPLLKSLLDHCLPYALLHGFSSSHFLWR